jgi:hypothetical protein
LTWDRYTIARQFVYGINQLQDFRAPIHFGLTTLDKLAYVFGMDSNTAKLILEIGSTIGASKFAVAKWASRGVPYRWRMKIIKSAALRGVHLSEEDFDAGAMASARRAA